MSSKLSSGVGCSSAKVCSGCAGVAPATAVYAGGLEGSGSPSGPPASGAGSCERARYAGGTAVAGDGAGADLLSRDLGMTDAADKLARARAKVSGAHVGARARSGGGGRRPGTHLQTGHVVLRSKHALHMTVLVQQDKLTVPQLSIAVGVTHTQQMPLARSCLVLPPPGAMVPSSSRTTRGVLCCAC